jgi:tetratricopeptide (TPR) repeat protein
MPGAEQSYRKAVVIAEALAAEDPRNATAQDELAVSYAGLGNVLTKVGRRIDALQNHRKALAIRETLAAGDPTNLRQP